MPPDLYATAGAQYGVDPLLLRAMAQVESGGQPNPDQAVSDQGAVGRMQMEPATAAEMGVADPTDPAQAIPGAARYLVQGYAATGSPAGAVLYYHGGPDRSLWGPKTQAYLAKVSAAYQALKAGEGSTGAASSAPPATTAPARPPDAAMASQWGIEAPASSMPSAATAAPSGAPARPADAAMEQLWGIGGDAGDTGDSPAVQAALARARQNVAVESAAAPPVTTPAPAAPVNPDQVAAQASGVLQSPAFRALTGITVPSQLLTSNLAAGVMSGVHSVLDPAAEYVANKLSPLVGGPSGAQTAASDAQGRADYAQNYGNSGLASTGRFIGQTAATLPLIMSAGGLLGAAGDVLGTVGGEIAPSVGNAISTAGDYLAGTGGNNMLTRTLSRGVAGAGQGAMVGALTSGQSDEPVGQQIKQGAETGAAVGALVGPTAAAIGRGVASLGRSAGTDLAQLADLAVNKFGIPLRADQVSGSPVMRKVGQMVGQIPGSGLDAGGQLSAFTRAVSNTFGENAPELTPQVMQAAKTRIGGVLNAIESTHDVTFGNDFVDRLADIERNAESTLPAPEFSVVKKQLDNVLANVKPGDTISGETFGNLIHQGSPLDAALNSRDANLANYAGQIKDALRDAMQASLPATDQAVYQGARLQYKNMMTVAPLVVRGAPGVISPAALQARVAASFKNAAFSGAGDLGQLAQIGQTFLKAPADSGTPLGLGVLHGLTRPGALVGELAGAGVAGHLAYLNPLEAIGVAGAGALGAGATVGLNRALAAGLKSPAVVNYMIRSGLAPRSVGGISNALTNALTGPYAAPVGVLAANRLLPSQAPAPAQ